MATVKVETKYSCYDDCKQQGCPGHKLELSFHTVTNGYSFKKDDSHPEFFEQGELEAMIKLLKELSKSRRDSLQI